MIQTSGVIICLSYILGLLLTAVPGSGIWMLLLGIAAAVFSRRHINIRQFADKKALATKKKTLEPSWTIMPHPRIWLAAGFIGLLATVYFQMRVPHPEAQDISTFVLADNKTNQEQLMMVRGEVISNPRLTRAGKGQFWLKVTQLDEVKSEKGSIDAAKGVTGKLYVTVPVLQSTGLYPSQQITVTGVLYKPKAALNPGSFDFQKFLSQEGTFAGLMGKQVSLLDEQRKWGWWDIRTQIVRSQVRSLSIPEGLTS